jgi:hypothetical protein
VRPVSNLNDVRIACMHQWHRSAGGAGGLRGLKCDTRGGRDWEGGAGRERGSKEEGGSEREHGLHGEARAGQAGPSVKRAAAWPSLSGGLAGAVLLPCQEELRQHLFWWNQGGLIANARQSHRTLSN